MGKSRRAANANIKKFAHKLNITCGLWDAFKDFKKKYKLIYPKIDRKKYVAICHMVNEMLSDKIIKESFEFRMPYRLGTLAITKQKAKINIKDGKLQKNKMIIDWGKTWDYWYNEYPGLSRKQINLIPEKVVIYNMNDHTNGYVMSWTWNKYTCRVVNQTVYYFKPTKRNRLALAAWIKSEEKENDYFLRKPNYKNERTIIKQFRKEERVPNLEQEG